MQSNFSPDAGIRGTAHKNADGERVLTDCIQTLMRMPVRLDGSRMPNVIKIEAHAIDLKCLPHTVTTVSAAEKPNLHFFRLIISTEMARSIEESS